MTMLLALYLIGITAEAMTGALAAGRLRMDLFGVVMVACVTAMGGGSIRDVLLGHYPLTWVAHPEYLGLTAAAALVTTWVAPLMQRLRMLFLVLDALGHYAEIEGKHAGECAEMRAELRQNLLKTLVGEYNRTGYLWEQYVDGLGKGSHPFTGWTALLVLIASE